MKTLSKKYRIVHIGNKLLTELEEYNIDSQTTVNDEFDSYETDSLSDAQEYIQKNELIYEPIIEDSL